MKSKTLTFTFIQPWHCYTSIDMSFYLEIVERSLFISLENYELIPNNNSIVRHDMKKIHYQHSPLKVTFFCEA